MEYPRAKIKKNGKVVGTNDSMWQTKRKRKVGPDLDSMAVPPPRSRKNIYKMRILKRIQIPQLIMRMILLNSMKRLI